MLDNARAITDHSERERQAAPEQPYEWTERNYGHPGFYGCGDISHETNERLKDGLFKLVNAVGRPAPPGTPPCSPERDPRAGGFKANRPWPKVLDGKHAKWDWPALILLKPEEREAISAFYHSVRAAIENAYDLGRQRG